MSVYFSNESKQVVLARNSQPTNLESTDCSKVKRALHYKCLLYYCILDLKANQWKAYSGVDLGQINAISDAQREYDTKVPYPGVKDVMGALIEPEKHIPKAGASLLPHFFPGDVDFEPRFHIPREQKF